MHAREELGVDPDDLASPMLAAVSSFVAFAVGALVPVLPYLLGADNLLPGLAVTLLALFACGAVVTQVTNRSWWFGGAAADGPRRGRGRPDLPVRLAGRHRLG